ncbi:MAG: hypothetical protein ACE5IQ_09230 [Candidatus Methylomirabilales bacterium]
MRVECYAATRPQDGRTANENAFLIIRDGIPVAAVCDGAGVAEQVAKRVVRLFELWVREVTIGQILRKICIMSPEHRPEVNVRPA